MTRIAEMNKNRVLSNLLIMAGLGLAFCLGSLPASAQQNQQDDVQGTMEQQQPPQQMPPQQQPPQQMPQKQGGQQTYDQAPPPQAVPPQTLTIPAGTVIRVRVDEWLSSDRNLSGDSFSATLDQPVIVDGWVVARRGQSETGVVSQAKKAGRVSGTSQLGVQLTELTLVDGQQMALQTQLLQTSAGTSHGADAAAIGTTTGVGAAIGAVADGGVGAGIGAGAGAVAGLIGVLSTRGKPTVIPPETVLSFRLEAPVTVSTEKSQFAFQPVNQNDINSRGPNGRMQRFGPQAGPGYPPPAPYYGYPYPYAYSYPYSYYGYYPAPFAFGFYGGYGRYRGGWRR